MVGDKYELISGVAGSFDSGVTVTDPADVIWDEFSGKYYSRRGGYFYHIFNNISGHY